jgi:hypothetical protein
MEFRNEKKEKRFIRGCPSCPPVPYHALINSDVDDGRLIARAIVISGAVIVTRTVIVARAVVIIRTAVVLVITAVAVTTAMFDHLGLAPGLKNHGGQDPGKY